MSGGVAKSLRSTNDRLRVASDSASNLQSLVNNADREVVVSRHHALRKSGDFALDLHGLGLVGKNEVDRFDPADDKRGHRIGVGINQAFRRIKRSDGELALVLRNRSENPARLVLFHGEEK